MSLPLAKPDVDSVEPVTAKTQPRSNRPRNRTSREGLLQTVEAAASLLEEGDRAHSGIASDARDLLLSEIEPDPLQPRRRIDEEELQALAEDIARRGVLQPIIVRPPATPNDRYILVLGERRWRASAIANKVRIPARIRDMAEDEVAAAQIAENVLRSDLSDIEKGKALRRLYEIRKNRSETTTWEDIAAEVGLGRARIHDLFRLAMLPDEIAALIENGRISGSHGIALQRARQQLTDVQMLAFAERAARPEGRRKGSYGLSVARLRTELQNAITQPNPPVEPEMNSVPDSQPNTVVKPRAFVQRLLTSVTKNQLTDTEIALLQEALQKLEISRKPAESP